MRLQIPLHRQRPCCLRLAVFEAAISWSTMAHVCREYKLCLSRYPPQSNVVLGLGSLASYSLWRCCTRVVTFCYVKCSVQNAGPAHIMRFVTPEMGTRFFRTIIFLLFKGD